MVRVITQETFNEAVQENVDILGISFEEALEEAIKQFEAQNVDLSNISKDVMKSPIDDVPLLNAIKTLVNYNEGKLSSLDQSQEPMECLRIIKEECDKGTEYKILAGKNGAYEQILILLSKNGLNNNVQVAALKSMLALITKQPDLLDAKGVEVILQYIDSKQDLEFIKLSLKWARECCILHEMNRQKLYNADILAKLKVLLCVENSEVLRLVLALFRALVLDDDIRVEFGKAHEHARGIAEETLPDLTKLLNRFKHDENVINDLLLTLSNLLVRNEFCKQVGSEGGLELIREVMDEFNHNDKIIRQCFKLLKALAGNDDCKTQVIAKGIAPLITLALNKNMKSVPVTTAGLACVAALCLRCPENSKVLFETGVPEVIVQAMRNYPNEKSIQKSGSWAIRNMVSRSKYQSAHFIELGVEDILKEALKNFKEHEFDVKSALRDLGCDVDLKEEWTGKGGLLNHSK